MYKKILQMIGLGEKGDYTNTEFTEQHDQGNGQQHIGVDVALNELSKAWANLANTTIQSSESIGSSFKLIYNDLAEKQITSLGNKMKNAKKRQRKKYQKQIMTLKGEDE